ncbi:MAG: cyclopropane-fatty-acyl-phospholipid synthase family protein [Lysobacterales bacterium]|jgi:cyclopropane-fatty-acyl-phospholipid synthase
MAQTPQTRILSGREAGPFIVRWLMKTAGNPEITIRLWDGSEFDVTDRPSAGMLEFRDRKALFRLLASPSVGFGECYAEGLLEVHGDFLAFMNAVARALRRRQAGAYGRNRLRSGLHALRQNTPLRATRNARHHYDLDNNFYRLWLDERMVYTCAYFDKKDATLEEAQLAKLDHVCRKIGLQPGMRVIEAGCGWGALALHMAEHYGARVQAYNVSRAQVEWARARAAERGLEDRVRFELDDYRNIEGHCDRFVSVGMLEHVGLANYRVLGDIVNRVLAPDGLALVHTIGRSHPRVADAWIRKYIFPGGHIPSLGEMAGLFEPNRFTVLDIENLRLHYARTCAEWLRNFEAVSERVTERFGEAFTRMWRLYLAGASAGFRSGTLQLYQAVFTHGDNNAVPRTRAYMYPGKTGAAG